MFCNGAWLTPREMNISGSNLSLLRPENAPELFPPSERERRTKVRSDGPCTITRGAPIAARTDGACGARGGGGRRACACTARAIVESAQRWRTTRMEHAAAEDAECGGDRAGGAGRSRVSAARSKARERRALETRERAAMARVVRAAAADAERGASRQRREITRERRGLESAQRWRARCTPRRRRTLGVRSAPEQAAGHARCTPGGGGRRACAVHLSRRRVTHKRHALERRSATSA
ncbi:hypothetical protein GGX14DRAFT_633722 [Mycena pura]|uniref:Uncharacterized protein n=1 Tax=Mycena pura TaxID=153505 RepID=A0AAD6VCD9_9AGAR|nr:hypothetical protein GGX14DRAFT_633722 [Mycena pura]